MTASAAPTTAETTLRNRLSLLGFAASTKSGADVVAADASQKAVVVLAPGALTGLGSKLRDVATPVVVANLSWFPSMALTDSTVGTHFYFQSSQTQLAVIDPLNPLAAHLAGTRTILSAGGDLGWGVPAASGFSAAVSIVNPLAPNPAPSVLLGYEAGKVMFQSAVALERRVGFEFVSNPANLTADGWAFFDAAVLWAAQSDGDKDGLSYADEIRLGTNTSDPDTNDDGVLDGAEVKSGQSPTNADMDGDGLTNAQELLKGTDPFNPDTDGDGSLDVECFPLDPTRTGACATTGDGVPPTITLTKPVGFVQTGTIPPL